MIIKPSVRSNFFTNAHPLGVQKMIKNYIKDVKNLEPFKGPKNVLIIGGSSGYGLASRISLAFGANAHTINVSFESQPKGSKTGSAGFWNNLFFQDEVKNLNTKHIDFNADAFLLETKQTILETIKKEFGQIDLLIYSLASGVRKNIDTGDMVRSSIKPLGSPAVGRTIDIKSMQVEPLTVEPATESETNDTVFVMGGGDWYDWVTFLEKNGALAQNFKTISYTYIGGKNTDAIYRSGTLGKAKEDLELKSEIMNKMLKEKYQGESLISSSKAIVSKASVFIPQMPIYVSYLFDEMLKNKTHETTLEHKHRLFKDMVYGNQRILDDLGRIRLDHMEMKEPIQNDIHELMHKDITPEFLKLEGTKLFIKEFYNINGFSVDGINEELDVDLEKLIENYKTNNYINLVTS
ncbi:trans-2-enoyl-CoA reductase family protein [Acholeplasma granularum]|uniref:trans-2-enoyl-CoA reductase family protein n=1 Tax=Acholeplasma granularum TaxID=264635 RepID=UPI00046FBF2B|nr:trans-2-enoyl-CoA reductase family protein [Acholeplasma granularum]